MAERARLAKLTRPSPAAAYPRNRLFEALQQRTTIAPVVWLAGPPGSGKTTLVADYTARHGIECLWYQMDRGDADIASFFHYLSEALHRHVGDQALPQFQPEYLADVEAFARNFFREAYRRLSAPLLVFDNFQDLLDNAVLIGVLQQALTELPDDGRVIVLSRADPPAGFAGLRARGKLVVIGWNDLRLTVEECRGVAEVRGARLSEELVQQLYARTQGWAAGVVLMLQDMRSGAKALSRSIGDVPTVIFDYLAEEIFQKLPPVVRESLLRLAYLPQITASMAQRLGVDTDSRIALAELARSEFLATVMHVEPEPISQFHPLLREFLLARAEEIGSAGEIEQRKRLAAQVLAESEHIEAAAALLIRIRDWGGLGQLIARHADALLRQGRVSLLEQWLQALPESDREQDPWLLHWMAACRFPYAPREARELFARAYRRLEACSPVDVRAVLAALNGVLEAVLHDSADDYAVLDPWIEAATRWTCDLTEWPAPDIEARLTCNVFLAAALRRPDHPHLHEWRARTQVIGQEQRDPGVRMTMDSALVVLSAWSGQFVAGERLLEGLRELPGASDASPVAALHVAQAEATFYMLSGDRAPCLEAVQRGLEIAQRSGVRLWNDTFLANALCGVLSEGDLDAAADYLARIESNPSSGRRYDVFLRAYGAGWYAMLRGDAFLAHQHLKRAARAAAEVGLPAFQALACLALAQVLMDAADERGAERELTRATELVAALNNRLFDFMTSLCRARHAQVRGDVSALNDALRTALNIGRERGLTYHLWWQPKVMARLLQHALQHDIERDFVCRLIERRHLRPEAAACQLLSWPWRYRVRAFGSFQMEMQRATTAAVSKRASRPLELLKAVIAAGGRQVKQSQLADALWPRIDSDYAHRSLNTTLHRLRKLLGTDSALVVLAGTVGLNRELFWLDVWAFDEACAQVGALVAEQAAANVADTLLSALDLYRGPLFEHDTDLTWAAAPRDQRRAQLLRLIHTGSQALEKGGQGETVIELHRRALECEPGAEALYRRLMIALKKVGRAAEAIEVYHACVAALRTRLDAPPSPATTDVYRSLLQG